MYSKAYLVLVSDCNGAPLHVTVLSEPPWTMSRMFGATAPVYSALLEGGGDSYAEARDGLVEMYPRVMPTLAARFPVQP